VDTADTMDSAPGGLREASSSTLRFLRRKHLLPWLALIVIIAAFAGDNLRMVSGLNIETIVDQASILGLVAFGETFVILAGSIDLSVEGVMGASSVVTAVLVANSTNHMNLGYGGVAIGAGVGLGFGLANGICVGVLGLPSFITTLGMWFVGLGVGDALTGVDSPDITSNTLLNLGIERFGGLEVTVFAVVVIALVLIVVERRTTFGRGLYAIGGGEQVARSVGMPVAQYKVAAFAVAGLLYGIAGVILTLELGQGNVTTGSGYLFTSITAVVVGGTLLTGGVGGVVQSILGTILVSVVLSGMVMVGIPSSIQSSFEGIVIVIAAAAILRGRQKRGLVVK
jgi:ribose transport system permease protein